MAYRGEVKRWNRAGGFGFLSSRDLDEELYVHFSAFGGGDLIEGESLTFDIDVDTRSGKNKAVNVGGRAVDKRGPTEEDKRGSKGGKGKGFDDRDRGYGGGRGYGGDRALDRRDDRGLDRRDDRGYGGDRGVDRRDDRGYDRPDDRVVDRRDDRGYGRDERYSGAKGGYDRDDRGQARDVRDRAYGGDRGYDRREENSRGYGRDEQYGGKAPVRDDRVVDRRDDRGYGRDERYSGGKGGDVRDRDVRAQPRDVRDRAYGGGYVDRDRGQDRREDRPGHGRDDRYEPTRY